MLVRGDGPSRTPHPGPAEDLAGTGVSVKVGIHGRRVQETLVSNLSEPSSTELRVGDAGGTTVAQGFATGAHPGGYDFTGVSRAADQKPAQRRGDHNFQDL